MATKYISTTGNDSTGDGSIGTPWRTLFKATSVVTTPGDIIHVVAGTYNETQQSILAPGVSIEGEGPANNGNPANIPTSIITSTLTAAFTPIIDASSVQGTNGNQHISNLKFDGQLTTYWGIVFGGRSNVSIYDCYITRLLDRGVIIHGRNDYSQAAPSTYASGCAFYHNTITDSSRFITDGTGCLCIGGTVGMLIHHNYLEQLNRASGSIGWPLKLENDGYNKALQIYNNTFRKSPWTGSYGGQFGWNFCIELWNCQGGMEIYNNDFQGSLDLVHVAKGSYSFGAHIHDNLFSQPVLNNKVEDGLFFEKGGSDILIENNVFSNLTRGVVIECEYFGGADNPVNTVNNVLIRNNLFKNLGKNVGDGNEGYGFLIGGGNNPQLATAIVSNIEIYNNTYTAYAGNAPYFCFGFNTDISPGTISNVKIINNIVKGFYGAYLVANPRTASWDGLTIKNNILYQNSNNNDIWPGFSTPSNYINTGNLTSNPNLDSNFQPNVGSPAIDAGLYVGIPFNDTAPDIGYFETGGAPGNIPPIADAGSNQTIVLPTNSVSVSASGSTDGDGTISSYLWTRISGPNTPTIVSATSVTTNITGLIAGTYVFQVLVTDNLGSTSTDTVQITVSQPSLTKIAPTDILSGILPDNVIVSSKKDSTNDASIADTAFVQRLIATKQNVTSLTTLGTGAASLINGVLNIPIGGSGGGTQTPWVSNINANGYDLNNVKKLSIILPSSGGTYATWNPSDKYLMTLFNGNLNATKEVGGNSIVRSTLGMSSGTAYFEVTCNTITDNTAIGICTSAAFLYDIPGQDVNSYAYWSNGFVFEDGGDSGASPAAYTNGDIIGIAVDMDTFTIKFYKNNVLQHTTTGVNPGTYYAVVGGQDNSPLSVTTTNFGQTSFNYAVPAGYRNGFYTGGTGTTQVLSTDDNGNVGVGEVPSGNYKFEVTGSTKLNGALYEVIGGIFAGGTYNVTDTDKYVFMEGPSGCNVVLPASTLQSGRSITVKRTGGSGTHTVTTTASEAIDGGAGSYTLTGVNKYVTFVCSGTSWYIVGNN